MNINCIFVFDVNQTETHKKKNVLKNVFQHLSLLLKLKYYPCSVVKYHVNRIKLILNGFDHSLSLTSSAQLKIGSKMVFVES